MDTENKEKLLRAAIPLFAEFGYDKVSIRQISEAAGVNSALISYHFGGKQGLYDAILFKLTEKIREFLSENHTDESPESILCAYADIMERLHAEYPEILKYIMREIVKPPAEISPVLRHMAPLMYAQLGHALLEGIKAGRFRPDLDIPSAVVLLVGAVNFYFLSHNAHQVLSPAFPQMADERSYLLQTMRIFLKGIEKEEL